MLIAPNIFGAHVGVLLLLLCWTGSICMARRHHLFVGNLNLPAAIHSLVFDDESSEFAVLRTLAADSSQAWLTFNHDMTHVYGVSLDVPRIASYDVVNNTVLNLVGAVNAKGRCTNRTSAYILASKRFPHYVFSASWPGPRGCGMSDYVSPMGELADMAYSWSYSNQSGIHGLAFGWGYNQLLYSADLTADAIWTHVFGLYGETYFLSRFPLPPGSRPKHIATHPFGRYLYAVMEGTSQLVSLLLDPYSGVVTSNDSSYSLLPPGQSPVNHGAAGVMLSRSARYLWATAKAKPNTSYSGYLSAFLLDDDGSIIKKMFTVSTTTTGGVQNAIAPAPWDDEWAAMTDAPTGYVQMWRMRGGRDTDNGMDYSTAEAVARVDIADGGCCANAIWYN